MSWFEQLCGLYEYLEDVAPLYHEQRRADIVIELDSCGEAVGARYAGYSVPVPVTVKSASRTTAGSPHPLADRLEYIAGDFTEYYPENTCAAGNFEAYRAQLADWVRSDYSGKFVRAVYSFIERGRLLEEISPYFSDSLTESDLRVGRMFAVFKVDDVAQWEDRELRESFIAYSRSFAGESRLCCGTGVYEPPAGVHQRGIIAGSSAKLIVSQNVSVLPYFASVGAEQAQRAGNALQTLLGRVGFAVGNRVFAAFSSRGELFKISPLFSNIGCDELLRKSEESTLGIVVVLAAEAFTKGRISLTLYSEIPRSDFTAHVRAHCKRHGLSITTLAQEKFGRENFMVKREQYCQRMLQEILGI